MAAQMEARAILSAEDRASAVLAMVARNFDKLNKAADRINRADAGLAGANTHLERRAALMSRVSSMATTMAAGAALAAPAAATALALKAAKAYAEQERAMTRIAITGDATRVQQDQAALSVERLADKTGQSAAAVRGGLDSMVASGRSFTESMAALPGITRAATATGAEVRDMATTTAAMMDNFGISAAGVERAYDLLAKGGKLGKFELKDQARYLPSLLPAAKALGLAGEEGLAKVSAMLQTVRAGTGTAEEAAASVNNIFAKMESEETTKRFKKMGVDLRKEMAAARRDGKDLLETFVGLSDKALKGDVSKLPQLFSDMEFARGMRAMITMRDKYAGFLRDIKGAAGTIDADFSRVMQDTQTGFDRAAAAGNRFVQNLGNIPVIKAGMNGLASVINTLNERLERAGETSRRLAEAGVKPVARTRTAAERDAERQVAIARFLAEHAANPMPDVDDRFAGERRKKSPQEAARIAIERARVDEDFRATAGREARARVVQDKAREAEEIARGSGSYGDAVTVARAGVDAQRRAGDTVASIDSTIGQNLSQAASALNSLAYSAQRQQEGRDGLTDDQRQRIGRDLFAFVGEAMDRIRQKEGGDAPADAEVSNLVKQLVAAAEAVGRAGKPGSITTADVENAATTGKVEAVVKPDQITAKSDVSITGGVTVKVEPSGELIRAYAIANQIIAQGGSGPAVNLGGRTNP